MTIPAASIVQVIPGVISAGGNQLILNGLFLTQSTRIPINTVQSFASQPAVAAFFGATSIEAAKATRYFGGFIGSTKLPGSMLFAQYPTAAVAAYLRGGNAQALGLPAIKALSGSLTLTVDGAAHVAASVDLSGATSFSAAAALIQAGLSNPTEATFTGAIATNTLTVSAVASGTLSVGQTVSGAGVPPGTVITALGTGTGLAGTYTLNQTATFASGSLTAIATAPTVTFDSVSGAFVVTSGITGIASTAGFATGTLAASLLLTSATGAVLSQGAAAATPGPFMDGIVQISQNWATFTTSFNPDADGENTQKLAFAVWNNGQNNRFAYVAWDTDQSPTVEAPATGSLGFLIGPQGQNLSGTILISTPSDLHHAAFVMGYAASIDFSATNGRATLAFKSQSGLVAGVSTQQAAANLQQNGYNYYGAFATANQNFLFMYPGSISGPFLWADSYLDQVWLNSQLQLALMELLANVKSVPFNDAGAALIEAAIQDPVNQAINFGAIRAGVQLSQAQAAEVNNMVGKAIDQTLTQQGWYLNIVQPQAQIRAQRQLPGLTLFWVDGQSVQQIVLSSLEVQ